MKTAVKKIFKRLGIALLALTAFVLICAVLFYVIENVRGKRAWEQYKRECATRGEDIEDWQSLIPPPIPDDDNIAMTPIFQDLLLPRAERKTDLTLPSLPPPLRTTNTVSGSVWQTGKYEKLDGWRIAFSNDNLLAALSVYDGYLREIEEALQRPFFRPKEWDTISTTFDPPVLAVNLAQFVRLYNLRARVRLEAGHCNEVLEDINAGLRVAVIEQASPFYVSAIVRSGLHSVVCSIVWIGISERAWDAQQLRTLQDRLGTINLVEHAARANRFESRWFAYELRTAPRKRTFSNMLPVRFSLHHEPTYDFPWNIVIHLIPKGWLSHNAVHVAKGYDAFSPAIDADDRRFDVAYLKQIEETEWTYPEIDISIVYSLAARVFRPTISTFTNQSLV